MNKFPIGVFDSGIGGLSVVKQIMQTLPNEDIIYFGDIARIPYGTKSTATIREFTRQTVSFLLEKKVKALVIACNTISAVAYETVSELAGQIPVIDVISGGIDAIVNHNKVYKSVGIIATPVTIKSNAYQNGIRRHTKTNINIISKACPLFVPLIEEGLLDHPAMNAIATDYLEIFNQNKIDALILGCTHYPMITNVIQNTIHYKLDIIDPAINTSHILRHKLTSLNLLHPKTHTPHYTFYITDNLDKFIKLGEMFLNIALPNTHLVTI